MAFIVLVAFIAVPLIEIGVFIEVGGWLGLWPTLGVVILTAIVGTWMLRLQGLATLQRAQSSMEKGELPMRAVFDGACLLVAGALLLTPGFVTDALGGLLFLPPVRTLLLAFLARRLSARVHMHASQQTAAGDGVIDGQWEEVTTFEEIDVVRPENGTNNRRNDPR